MTELEAINSVKNRRAKICHDVLQNEFFSLVGSGWKETDIRGGSADLIFSALLNPNCESAKYLTEASEVWERMVAPELRLFLFEIPSKYGFVPKQDWEATTSTILEKISLVSERMTNFRSVPKDKAPEIAKEIWSAIDQIRNFLETLGVKFWKYFESYDPRRISS